MITVTDSLYIKTTFFVEKKIILPYNVDLCTHNIMGVLIIIIIIIIIIYNICIVVDVRSFGEVVLEWFRYQSFWFWARVIEVF